MGTPKNTSRTLMNKMRWKKHIMLYEPFDSIFNNLL